MALQFALNPTKAGKRGQRRVTRRFEWAFPLAVVVLLVAVASLRHDGRGLLSSSSSLLSSLSPTVLLCDAFTAPSSLSLSASTSTSTSSSVSNNNRRRQRIHHWQGEKIQTTSILTSMSTPSSRSSKSLTAIYDTSTPVDSSSNSNDDETTKASNSNTDNAASSVEYSFYDEVTIFIKAGSGGQGASTYRKGVGGQNGPPDGGNGGNGGNVILMVDDSLNTLAGLSPVAYKVNSFGGSGAAVSAAQQGQGRRPRYKSFRAEIGCDGGRQMKSGRYGKDIVIKVPPGTVVHEIIENEDDEFDDEYDDDNEYGDDNDNNTKETLVELGTLLLPEQGGEVINNNAMGSDNNGEVPMTRRMRSSLMQYAAKPTTTLVVATGGEGGEGSGINQKGRGLQRPRLSPQGGEKRKLRLTLKLVADVALVGVPNAGKSTFLSKVTRAKPRIADYPFTTVIPNLGVWVPPELFENDGRGTKGGGGGTGGNGLVLCDVPGLIEGASRGIGLGHAFLRHVERCHVILHLVDATAEDPVGEFKMLNAELIKYGTGQLARMPQVVVINKTDAYDNDYGDGSVKKPRFSLQELEAQLKDAMSHSRLMQMSAIEGEGVDDLMVRLSAFVKKVT